MVRLVLLRILNAQKTLGWLSFKWFIYFVFKLFSTRFYATQKFFLVLSYFIVLFTWLLIIKLHCWIGTLSAVFKVKLACIIPATWVLLAVCVFMFMYFFIELSCLSRIYYYIICKLIEKYIFLTLMYTKLIIHNIFLEKERSFWMNLGLVFITPLNATI